MLRFKTMDKELQWIVITAGFTFLWAFTHWYDLTHFFGHGGNSDVVELLRGVFLMSLSYIWLGNYFVTNIIDPFLQGYNNSRKKSFTLFFRGLVG